MIATKYNKCMNYNIIYIDHYKLKLLIKFAGNSSYHFPAIILWWIYTIPQD